MALSVFTTLDPTVTVEFGHRDGDDVQAGATLAGVAGAARVLLSGERTALNLLGRMSGIATTTRDLTVAVGANKARIVCEGILIPRGGGAEYGLQSNIP